MTGGVKTDTLIFNFIWKYVKQKRETMKRRNKQKDEFISFAVVLARMLNEEEGMSFKEYNAFKEWWITEFKLRFPCFTNRIVLKCWSNFEADLKIKVRINESI